jgi:hypothetical protein
MVDLDYHKSTTNFEFVSIIIEVVPASFANCILCLQASASATITDATKSKNHASQHGNALLRPS